MKNYARKHPHSMGEWSADSKTNVAHMTADDFRNNEKSAVVETDGSLRIELQGDDGSTTVLRESVPVLAGEVVDATVMRVAALREFLTEQVARAKAEDVLFSVHLKATMMKVSDPIIFGHVVRAFLPDVFAEYGEHARRRGPLPERRARRDPRRARGRWTTGEAIKAAIEQGSRRRSARWRWSTPTAASPTCTCPPTSSSTRRCRR